jgi:hypothetical protein
MKKRVVVPSWAVSQLEEIKFEGWDLIRCKPLSGSRHLLIYEAEQEDDAPDDTAKGEKTSKVADDALALAVQQRPEPRVGDRYEVTSKMTYRPWSGGITYLLPAQVLRVADEIRVRDKLSTGVWRFDIATGKHRGLSFTVSRAEWEMMKFKLKLPDQGDQAKQAKADAKSDAKATSRSKDRDSSPLSKAGSYLRVTKKLPDLPTPKEFSTFFSFQLKKRERPEGDDAAGGAGRFGRRRF